MVFVVERYYNLHDFNHANKGLIPRAVRDGRLSGLVRLFIETLIVRTNVTMATS